MEKEKKNYFEQLNSIDCSGKTELIELGKKVERKKVLTYLSWSWAWAELKKIHPMAFYTVYENSEGLNYHHDGRTAWVKTGVTLKVDGEFIEHIEYLPVMDYQNNSIPVDKLTSFDVNKAIQRSLTKAVARHGLGLYIYAGEDLPEEVKTRREEDIDAEIAKIDNVHDLTELFKTLTPAERANPKIVDKFTKKKNDLQ